MSSAVLYRLQQKINGYTIRRNTLSELYSKENRMPTLIEIEVTDKIIEKLKKEIKRMTE